MDERLPDVDAGNFMPREKDVQRWGAKTAYATINDRIVLVNLGDFVRVVGQTKTDYDAQREQHEESDASHVCSSASRTRSSTALSMRRRSSCSR